MADLIDLGAAIVGGYVGSRGTDDQTTSPYMFPGQQAGVTDFLQRSRNQYGQGGRQYYPGQTVANLDPLQIQGQNTALGNVGAQTALGQMGAMSAANLAAGGDRVGGFQLADQVGFGLDPSLQAAVTNPIMRDLEQRVLPGMDLQATSQGAFGGSRAQQMKGQAGAQATEQMTDALTRANLAARGQTIDQRNSDITAQIHGRQQDINQNQLSNNARVQGLNAMQSAQGGLQAGANTMMDVGGQRQAYDQRLIEGDQARFNFGQNEWVDNLSRLGDRMVQPSFGGQTLEGTGTNLAGGFGGALTGWNAFRG